MLNRSHNPFLFPFNPFPLTLSHPPPPPITATQKTEFLEGGLKMEDFLVNYGQNDAVGQDFFVEDLLVDGGDGFFEAEPGTKHECEAEDKNPLPLKKTEPKAETEETKANTFGDFGAVPADDVAELEWLSNFVEDSFSGHSMMCQVTRNQSEPVQTSVPTPVQTKARTKRARTGGRIWSSQSLSQSSSSTSSSTESDAWLIYSAQTADSLPGGGIPPPPAKKHRRRPSAVVAHTGQQSVVQSVPRRCSHCGVQKTPQWRAGPNGAKTLCNACGVRYKSGRLFPEYRPACSPTFSSEMHSNNHRKVLEMRQKKDSNLGFNGGF